LRSLIYHAAERAVRDVYIDGRRVVADFAVLTLDQADAAARLTDAQARMLAAVRQRDYKRRGAEEITPLGLPIACPRARGAGHGGVPSSGACGSRDRRPARGLTPDHGMAP